MITVSDAPTGGRVDRTLARVYYRLGARLVYVVYAANIAISALTGLVALLWVQRYFALSTADVVLIVALLLGAGVPVGALVLWTWRDTFATVLSWSGADRTAERAPIVWASLVRRPYVVSARAFVASSALMVPFTALIFAVGIDHSWLAAIPFYASTMATLLACGVLWTFGAEFALRPMLRDVAAHLPVTSSPRRAPCACSASRSRPCPS